MATKQWTGTGDWFSTLWLDITTSTPTASGPPQPGDSAYVFSGGVTITAADAVAHPTIDGVTLFLAAASAGVVPTLDATNVAFGAAMFIDNSVNNGSALVVARGTVSLAGTLAGDAVGAPTLTLDIEDASGLASFGNSGTVEADNTGNLQVVGAADATLANSGLLLASNGTVDVATAVVSTGTLEATQTGTLVLTGSVSNRGTMIAAQPLGRDTFAPGWIYISGSLTNTSGGAITAVTFGTIAAVGGVTNSGAITNDGGTIDLDGGLANTGQITDQAGTLTITGGVTGLGTIAIAQEVDISGPVAAGQVVTFASNDAMLRLTNPGSFAGSITDMTAHDLIDLQGLVADSTTYDSASGLLTLFDGTTAVGSLDIPGLSGPLGTADDLFGGTILTTEQAGTPSQVAAYMVANSADGAGAHNWPLPDPVITYGFLAASNWTGTEQAAFQNAMALWSDVANVTFQQISSGTPDLLIERASNGEANTFSNFSGGINTSSTIAIDTSVPGWTDLSDLGTSDASGFGGYGFLTVLHELGHVLGLNHPGPYNETADITQQVFYTDTHQYTVMSYFDASESGADWTLDGTGINAQTPMLYDILAAQQIYGANTTTLTGDDTFGFNSTFGTASLHPLRQYDFTQDTTPVVTLYDGGANNTLDLSGFSTASTIDLAPGTFSSADGLTDNIAIDYGTTIDSAVGGAGDDLFLTNGGSDTIDGGGGTNTVAFGGTLAQYTLGRSGNTITVTGFGATSDLTNVATIEFADQSIPASEVACFVRGTRIATPHGAVPVESLIAGRDHVLTRDGRAAPVRWVGNRDVDIARHPRPWDIRPVRIRAGAVGAGVPERDLLVSPDHALALDGVLVPARYLLNGATILPDERTTRAHYLHVELDRHDVLLAEGLPCESFLDTGNRTGFANGGAAVELHPDFARRTWDSDACAPLVLGGATLRRLRRRLAGRAASLGHARTDAPDLRLFADGRPVAIARRGGWLTAIVPGGATTLRLASRTWVPLHLHPEAAGDARRLGVAIADLRLDGLQVPLDDPRLAGGWHAREPNWRWTDGAATIAVHGATTLALRIALVGRYWREPGRTRKAAAA